MFCALYLIPLFDVKLPYFAPFYSMKQLKPIETKKQSVSYHYKNVFL